MANMSYCRFENICTDFDDCVTALENGLDGLSSSERAYAERLYELAKSYVGMYEMQLQAEEEKDLDEIDPKHLVHHHEKQERAWFCSYVRVQMEGKYNMITDPENACRACGFFDIDTYYYVQQNYNTFREMFQEDYRWISDEMLKISRS